MMKFATSTILLAGASSVLARPALLPRAITGPTRGYTCDVNGHDVSFTPAYITQAITHAAANKPNLDMIRELPRCDLSITKGQALDFCQPKEFNNRPVLGVGVLHFPDCPNGPWYEFPLLSDGHSIHSSPGAPGTQNPSRVVFQSTDSKTAKFCGVMVHHSSVNGNFIACT